MVNIAFPGMAATFGVSAPAMRWVIVCYVLSYAFLSSAGGALGDRMGSRRVFVVGMAGSAVAYVVAAAAPTFGWLLAGRVMQGLAGGLVYGTAPAIVTAGADRTGRTRALGFLNGALGLAFAIGPIVAGLLIATVGWRAVFSARAPLALIALVAALRGLRRDGPGALRGPVSVRDVLRRPVLHLGALPFLAFGGDFAIWLLAPFHIVERGGRLRVPGSHARHRRRCAHVGADLRARTRSARLRRGLRARAPDCRRDRAGRRGAGDAQARDDAAAQGLSTSPRVNERLAQNAPCCRASREGEGMGGEDSCPPSHLENQSAGSSATARCFTPRSPGPPSSRRSHRPRRRRSRERTRAAGDR